MAAVDARSRAAAPAAVVAAATTGEGYELTAIAAARLDRGHHIMMYALYIARRTQIYLDDEQDRQLVDRARQVGRTKSALIRDAIDAYLAPTSSQEAALAGLRAAVKDATGAAPHLPSGVDYVEELRVVERERQRVIDQRR